MEIQNDTQITSVTKLKCGNNTIKQHPSFKGAMPFTNIANIAMNTIGSTMQGIENGGFLVSFLIQDFLGMTVPRTCAGFLRDKEITGKYNTQEGFEVLGREGMTGPCMMAVAPIALLVAAKCGKSTSVNSQLIKRLGNSLKEIVSSKGFNRAILNDKTKFKEEFYKINIRKILEQTLGKECATEESVEHILQQLKNYETIPQGTKLAKFRGKAKYKNQCMQNIVEYIDNIKYSKSSDLDMLSKVKFGNEKFDEIKTFKTKNTFDAMIKYADDAITANKHIDALDEAAAESLKNLSLGKRILTNIAMVASTIGILFVLPKIYARSNVAPGARKNIQANTQQNKTEEETNLSFKGKKTSGLIEKLGKVLDKNKSDFISSELEYNGHNFTNTLMAGLSLFGLLLPRGLRAYSRAEKDENGKRDFTELWEILLRDVTSSLAVVFAVPMMTRAFVSSYEKNTGFVLMQKDRNMSKWKTVLDLINPYSKTHVLTNSELTKLYGNVDSREKMLNFCEYIDKNGGDLAKILSKSENSGEIFNENKLNLKALKGLSKTDKNKKIIDFVKEMENNSIKLLMKSADSSKNKLTRFARGLNSLPALLATVFISPYILGWAIPRLTYKNTRRIHEKEDRERAQKLKTNA